MPLNVSSLITPVGRAVGTQKPKPSRLVPTESLDCLPSEIQDQIFSYLDQRTLHSLLTSNSALTEGAAIALYERPKFASTYRFAQFVTTISHSDHYATMVRVLDLSEFTEDTRDMPMAGWREWKMRTEPLYNLTDQAPEPSWRRSNSPPPYTLHDPAKYKSTHPRPHRFLKQWAYCRDVPVGGLLHIFEACKRIKKIDLSYVSLADDYRLPPSLKYPLTAHTGLLFVSDVPKSWTWRDTDNLTKIPLHKITRDIAQLPLLEKIRIRGSYWLGAEDVKIILDDSKTLQRVDFRGSGMGIGLPWAVEGVAEVVRSIVDAM